jgi:hypothetical protein
VAENRLSGTGKCITSGQYLHDQIGSEPPSGALPILLADRTLLDETILVVISRTTAVASLASGQDASALTNWQSVGGETVDPNNALRGFEETVAEHFQNLSPIWLPGPVQYHQTADGALSPSSQAPDLSAYVNPFVQGVSSDLTIPAEAHDLWFRGLQDRYQTGAAGTPNTWDLLGRFDPTCVPGFSRFGSGSMGLFASPSVATSGGRTLGPNRSIAGLLDSPPLMLTTLAGAEYFADPKRFKGAPGARFISAIRVKVSDTDQVGRPAEERLSRVAAEIRDETGLQVDIVKGSSPRPVEIHMPQGNYGRPAITVSQNWASKGVLFRFFQAVSFQNLAIFALVLLAALILVGQTAFISVRRRRRELSVLRALGWPPWRIALLVELEMAVLGLAVGLVGLAVGVPATHVFHVNQSWLTTLGVVPLALVIALLAGAIPAFTTSRGPVLDGFFEPQRIHESALPASALLLGFRNARAWRWDTAACVASLALGGALLGAIELITAGFRGQLDATLLGAYISAQVRPFHFVLAGLTLCVGAVAAAELIALAYLERRPQLAMLRAIGWPRGDVVKILVGEAAGLGMFAASVAGCVTILCGLALRAPFDAILGSAALAMTMTIAAAGLAMIAPLGHAYAADVATSLRDE